MFAAKIPNESPYVGSCFSAESSCKFICGNWIDYKLDKVSVPCFEIALFLLYGYLTNSKLILCTAWTLDSISYTAKS